MSNVISLPNAERRRARTTLPFGKALRELLEAADITTPIGNPDWPAFAQRAGLNYESLRKTVVGNRLPAMHIMEAAADELGLSPEYFVEYRIALAREQFDIGKVGLEAAAANLERYVRATERDR